MAVEFIGLYLFVGTLWVTWDMKGAVLYTDEDTSWLSKGLSIIHLLIRMTRMIATWFTYVLEDIILWAHTNVRKEN